MTKSMCSIALLLFTVLTLNVIAPKVYGQGDQDISRKLELLNAYPDMIVVNGKIHTIDSQLTEVQAMAVKNSRIIALGTNDQIRFLAGPKTEVVDAKGRVVLPGLIDGHTHPHLWAIGHWLGAEGDMIAQKYNDPQLKIVLAKGQDGADLLRSLERVVRDTAQQRGQGKWIWAYLFAGNTGIPGNRRVLKTLFTQQGGGTGTITRQYLDSLAPNNPLIVMSNEAIGPGAHNTRAKEQMMAILGQEEDGLGARNPMTYDILFRGRTEEALDFLKRELLSCVSGQGITTFGNHYYGTPSIMNIYNKLYQRGEMPVRWAWWQGGGSAGGRLSEMGADAAKLQPLYADLFYEDLGDFRGIGNDFIWNAGVSNEGWEGGLTCTKAKQLPVIPTDPVVRDAGVRPDCATPIDYESKNGYQTVKAALQSGLRIGFMHGYSDGTYDALFHMLDEAVSSGKMTLEQVRSLRISTEHNPIIRPDQVTQMAKYNMMPAFNGYQVQGDIKGGAFIKVHGEQYMNWLAPMKGLVDAGAHPVFNTDAHVGKVPVEYKDMDYPEQWDGNIWGYLEFFVTRRMPHDGVTYARQEALDRVTLMKAATIWGAEQLLNEKNIGSLENGKLADFIIIDKDYFTIPENQIGTIKTLMTSTGGKIVFKASNY